MATHECIVNEWAEQAEANERACEDLRAAARRYLDDRRSGKWEFRTQLAEFVINGIETLFCHQQGESLDGRPLRGTPFLLQPWQLFDIYNVCGFFLPGTELRRYQEQFSMLARKNGKTPFTTAKIWMLGVAYSRSYSKIKTVAGSAKQNSTTSRQNQ